MKKQDKKLNIKSNREKGIIQTVFDSKKELSINRFGAFYVNLNSSQIVSVEPFEGDKFPHTMNNAIVDRIQNETRVLYPCVRKSYLENKGPNKANLRGQEEFVRVSWDVAIELAAKALKDNFEKYGPEAIYAECYWWGGCGKVGWGRAVARRMLKILGGHVEEKGDYSTGAGLVIMPHVFGSAMVYEPPTKWEAILQNCKHIVFWGTDPIVTNQTSIGVPTHTNYEYFTKIRDQKIAKKLKITSIDIYQNNTARYTQSDYISIIPNTDTAMMIGLCHYLYVSDLYDKNFIQKYTTGFDEFRDYFLGKNDKVVKDISWASKICGIDKNTLIKLATDLAKENSIIIAGRALQRQDHGEQAFWMIATLSAMLGHIGKTGCGFEFNLGYSSNGAFSAIAPKLKGITPIPSEKYTNTNSPWIKYQNYTIPSSRSVQALLNPGQEIDYNGKKIKLPHMRVAYNASTSPFTRHQNTNQAVRAWQNFDTIITAEPFWNSCAKLSDIVLPVATEPERVDILNSDGSSEYIFAMKKLIEPMGESKSDFEICRLICEKWGMGEVFSEGKTELEWVKEIYDKASDDARDLGYAKMPSFDEFWNKGFVYFDKIDESKKYYTRLQDYRNDPQKFKLNTPSGKIEIYSNQIAKMGYKDCLGHPTWFEPFEWLGNKQKTKTYPIALSSPHSRYRLHSQLDNSLIRQYASINGKEPMLISPKTAKERGIKTGDVVKIFNDRGAILCGALVTEIIQDNVIVVCEGAWYDPEEYTKEGLCQHGCVNVLTQDKGTSSLSQSNTAHTTLVQVQKYNGIIKPLKAFSKPEILDYFK